MLGLICLIIGVIASGTIMYFILQPKVQLDKHIQEENKKQYIINQELKDKYQILTIDYNNVQQQYTETKIKEQAIKDNLQSLNEQAEKNAEQMYNVSLQLAGEKMSAAAIKMAQEYENAQNEAKQNYLNLIQELSNELNNKLNADNQKLQSAAASLADLESKVKAATEAAKRQEEMAEQENFYRLILSEEDLEEIEKLREVGKVLRNPEPLNKVIWKVYYEKPYTDLIGRVIGSGKHTGIYKITSIATGKCYVGQCRDVSERWRQHIKRGLGAETPTRNKLYPAMQQLGVENFRFEWIEDCSPDSLDSREDYWQDYFGAKEFGYSIK